MEKNSGLRVSVEYQAEIGPRRWEVYVETTNSQVFTGTVTVAPSGQFGAETVGGVFLGWREKLELAARLIAEREIGSEFAKAVAVNLPQQETER